MSTDPVNTVKQTDKANAFLIEINYHEKEKIIIAKSLVLAIYCRDVNLLDVYVSLKTIYNRVATSYDMADRFGSISNSHHEAIAQIRRAHLGMRSHYRVLDLGVGPGEFLKKLRPFMPKAEFTGIDVSVEMLEKAKEKLNLTAIEGSATEASNFLPHHSQDLVLAHFINAYIPIETLFHEAGILTRANGHFSLITTTYESFPVAQEQLAKFIAEDSLISTVVGHYYKAIVKSTTVASGYDELAKVFGAHNFEIEQHKRIVVPIKIDTVDELARFGIEGTWFLNSLSMRMLPKNFLIERLKRLFARIFTFPYHDNHIIDIVLAKK